MLITVILYRQPFKMNSQMPTPDANNKVRFGATIRMCCGSNFIESEDQTDLNVTLWTDKSECHFIESSNYN